MTLTILTGAAVVVAAFCIILAIRTWQYEGRLLYLLIPLLLGFALATGFAINGMLGYPTSDLRDLSREFIFIAATGEDPVYLAAIPQGGSAPRLYAIPKSMLSGNEKNSLGHAQAKLGKGVPQAGVWSEGEFVFYDFDVARALPKSN